MDKIGSLIVIRSRVKAFPEVNVLHDSLFANDGADKDVFVSDGIMVLGINGSRAYGNHGIEPTQD